ncbi:MAG: tRNA glutamyl-Q(34) synthetase GluQRS [Verrucomicrobiae bacterium]|nr:tRNA glutamyl-Q(34) synthetase GluQRS [Verrucomicrobiae bacterium]NNJ44375.1 tRNA glutamyl-Q(34) synthetase GluQRS [Akkermansiaceae bacterium]
MLTRFAPSPTGLLHLGHAYAAVYAYDMAEENGGRFYLRFEDIDTTRIRSEFYLAIEQDLAWLGVQWDGTPIRQTDRLPIYQEALEELRSLGVIYPCFCTRREIQKEIEVMGNAPHGPEGAHYPGTCRALTSSEREDRINAGDTHCWRLDTRLAAKQTGSLVFEDEFEGQVVVDAHLLGDVVLARKDITTSYHLAVVIDDAFQKITDVTRGADLLASTHVHRTLQKLLALPAPHYHHHRLILDTHGKRLAKRNDALTIRSLRELGKSPTEVIDMLA